MWLLSSLGGGGQSAGEKNDHRRWKSLSFSSALIAGTWSVVFGLNATEAAAAMHACMHACIDRFGGPLATRVGLALRCRPSPTSAGVFCGKGGWSLLIGLARWRSRKRAMYMPVVVVARFPCGMSRISLMGRGEGVLGGGGNARPNGTSGLSTAELRWQP